MGLATYITDAPSELHSGGEAKVNSQETLGVLTPVLIRQQGAGSGGVLFLWPVKSQPWHQKADAGHDLAPMHLLESSNRPLNISFLRGIQRALGGFCVVK